MNPILIFLGFLAILWFWALLSFLYKPLGFIIYKIIDDVITQMTDLNKNKDEGDYKTNEK